MYFVIYKFYTEYNQFEGRWDVCIEKCEHETAARTFIELRKKDTDYKDFILTKKLNF